MLDHHHYCGRFLTWPGRRWFLICFIKFKECQDRTIIRYPGNNSYCGTTPDNILVSNDIFAKKEITSISVEADPTCMTEGKRSVGTWSVYMTAVKTDLICG